VVESARVSQFTRLDVLITSANSFTEDAMTIAKKRLLISVCFLVLLTSVICVTGRLSREPRYQGKPVSYWLSLVEKESVARSPTASPATPNYYYQAREAVRDIGPKALPYVAARMEGRAFSRLESSYAQLLGKLPSGIRSHLPQPKQSPGFPWLLGIGFFTDAAEQHGTNAITVLTSLYASSNAEIRRGVVLALGSIAPKDHARTVPVFERALHDPYPMVRFDALRQLCQMAGSDPQVAPILTTFLHTAGSNLPPSLRLETMAATGAGGTNTWEQAFALLGKWQHAPTSEIAQHVLAAFELAFKSNPEGPEGGLASPLQKVRFTAKQEADLLVPILVKGLKATSESARVGSAGILANLGDAAEPALPALIAALDDPAADVRREVMRALAHFGPKSAAAVPALARLLPTEEDYWRLSFALEHIGPAAHEAMPVLLRTAKETEDGEKRKELLDAAVKIDPKNPELIPMLVAILDAAKEAKVENAESDENEREKVDERVFAVATLGEIGPSAINTLPMLKKVMLEDSYLEPRMAAMIAIIEIAPMEGPDLVPVMVRAVSDWGSSDRYRPGEVVAQLLGRIGPAASPAVIPTLRKLAAHEHPLVCLEAAETLAKLAPEHKREAVEVLHKLIAGSREMSFRVYALRVLRRVQPDDPIIIPELIKQLKPSNEYSRAAQFLGEIGAPARSAVPQLREVLEYPDWQASRNARDALDEILAVEHQ
jgi:HEAT repeat protein